jgi:hypothetical protein
MSRGKRFAPQGVHYLTKLNMTGACRATPSAYAIFKKEVRLEIWNCI